MRRAARRRATLAGRRLLALALILAAPAPAVADEGEPEELVVWHSYRKGEQAALDKAVERYNAQLGGALRVVAKPYPHNVYADRLQKAIPLGNGPDVFVFAHERIGGWAQQGMLEPLPEARRQRTRAVYLSETLVPLEYEGKAYGLPLAFKSLALFYNKAVTPSPPETTAALIALGERLKGQGVFGLATMTTSFYFHAPWYFGFGGELLRNDGTVGFDSPGAIRSFAFIRELGAKGLVPDEPNGALVTSLFNQGQAATVINGPWFVSEIDDDVDYGVAPLPRIGADGPRAKPFLTVEAAFVSAKSTKKDAAWAFAEFLTRDLEIARLRAEVGRQTVALAAAWDVPEIATDPVLAAFRAQLPDTVPMDNRPAMALVWAPGDLALKKLMRGDVEPEAAARAAQREHTITSRPPPESVGELPYLILFAGLLITLLAFVLRAVLRVRRAGLMGRAALGWRWIAPAMGATFILVIVPFVVGLVLAFFSHHPDDSWHFVGLSNFGEILGTEHYGVLEPLSFYYALLVTVLWTAVNIVLHVAIGLGLALLLNRPMLKLKPVYRILLILPWAVPNYITALIWKGMFHKQFGAINGMLEGLGLDGVSWFSEFGTAFFANVCTNAWLGFPFMMVVCLGALQSIPRDLYQAATVDGANAWQRFRHVTWPLLQPALIPAVLLGIVWTFNQFNIIYLVSAGEPDHSTEILISEAYKWAFMRQDRFGYAAAYAALIFVILFAWSIVSVRAARRAEAMR